MLDACQLRCIAKVVAKNTGICREVRVFRNPCAILTSCQTTTDLLSRAFEEYGEVLEASRVKEFASKVLFSKKSETRLIYCEQFEYRFEYNPHKVTYFEHHAII